MIIQPDPWNDRPDNEKKWLLLLQGFGDKELS